MSLKSHITDITHHAYLIVGDRSHIKEELFDIIRSNGITIEGNPDVMYRNFEICTIDDARELKSLQVQKGVDAAGTKKILIIDTDFFTREAQHALLKVFEEPATDVHFFILMSSANNIIDTLLSRCNVINDTPIQNTAVEIERAKKFIEGEKEDRLSIVKELLGAHEKYSSPSVLKGDALSFLNTIEIALNSASDMRNTKEDFISLQEVWKCRKYMNQQGSSVKMLLEHLSLVI
ncbi:hypothetical protein COB64_01755 [Candidatus Wolfebacteria bacterium]|nr:MAG: hypothetical protein COB64_01755 [Candidatus Wolfebacteria bacterium]